MVVQHNLASMNANRMLGITEGKQAKTSEKLSSGYKINRAADDAAGLAISEKMRKQINGLDRASTNAQDGISAVQTAEGALTEVHSMLQRMNELVVQAANGTNSAEDRDAIQSEIEQLTTEIDRIADSTKFNETYLLKGNGSIGEKTLLAHDAGLEGDLVGRGSGAATFTREPLLEGDKVTIAGIEYTIVEDSEPNSYENINGYTVHSGDKFISRDDRKSYTYYEANDIDKYGREVLAPNWYENGDSTRPLNNDTAVLGDIFITQGVVKKFIGDAGQEYTVAEIGDVRAEIKNAAVGTDITVRDDLGNAIGTYTVGAVSNGTTYTAKDIAAMIEGKQHVAIGDKSFYYVRPTDSKKENEITIAEAYDKIEKELEAANNIGTDGDKRAEVKSNGDGSFEITLGKVEVNNAVSLVLHVGADADMTNKIGVNIDAMDAAGLGIKGMNVSDNTGIAATYAIDAIADAISIVSAQRSSLGAIQNRLEHTIDNLDNVVENTTASESRIRDTDMAEEMVEYSKNNILAQAGQSMLAQANQSTQGVLSLLQ